jgi:tRNA (cmo5U34)-methyltransferase
VTETASDYFGAMADEYDSLIRRAVPRYDEMIARTVEYMPEGSRRILELGCGTGNLTLAIARRFPEAELSLVDDAPEMLGLTRSRLEQGRVAHSIPGRFEDVVLPASMFDVVTSCISLHHVVDKRALFARLRVALRPGGVLVFSDQMRGQTVDNHAINWNRMTDFWRLPDHCTADEVRSLTAHAEQHDHYVSIVDQIHLLEEEGFRDLDCVWRNWMWGILWARA